MKHLCAIILLCLSLQACNDSDHLGYSRLEGSLHYQRIALGDASESVTSPEAAYLSFTLSYMNDSGKVVAIKTVERIPVADIEQQGKGVWQGLQIMNTEDSAIFIGDPIELELGKAFPELDFPASPKAQFSIRIDDVITDLEHRESLAQERLKHDPEMHEMAGLNAVLDSLGFDASDENEGMYFLSTLEGNGPKPVSGQMIWVNYIGRFASGEEFDNTYKGKLALEYQVGKPDQVIRGFGKGIALMRQGGRAIFVIPSPAGFGYRGSSSGVVPPYTTLIYEVHLLKVGV